MKNLKETLSYTLNEAKKDEKPKIQVVNLPMIERDARIQAMKKRFGASNFKRYDVDDFMKSKNEGFFFHYNPNANKYFEGNASFQFMFFKISTEKELSSPPEIDKYWNHYNFKVDHVNKTITAEKQWIDTKPVNAVIDKPAPWKTAVEIAVDRHPEIEDYKIKGIAGIKTVDELLDLPTLDVAGKDEEVEVFIAATLSQTREYLEDGIKDPFVAHLTFSLASSDARMNIDQDPDRAWAILKVTINAKNAERKYSSLEVDQNIRADDIEVVKISKPDALKKVQGRNYFKRYQDAWPTNTQEVIITDSEDIDTIINAHRVKARRQPRTTEIHSARVVEIPKRLGGWTLAIENKVTETQVKDILAYLKVEQIIRKWSFDSPIIDIEELRKMITDKFNSGDFEFFKEWIFENNPPQILARELMRSILDSEGIKYKNSFVEVIKKLFPMANLR